MKKIAVIGAGITGITTAYQLMKKGYDVTVFDKQKYAAMETSYANGGQLSACNGEVWTNWKTIYQGCLLYTSPSPRDEQSSRMPSSA